MLTKGGFGFMLSGSRGTALFVRAGYIFKKKKEKIDFRPLYFQRGMIIVPILCQRGGGGERVQ